MLLLNCFIDFWGLCGWWYWRLCLFFAVFLLVRWLQNGENPNPDINSTTGPAMHAALPEAVLNCWNVSAWIFDLSPAPIAMLTFWHCHLHCCCGSRCYKSEVGRGLCLITADRGSKDICCLTPQYEKESLWSKKEPSQKPAPSQKHQ